MKQVGHPNYIVMRNFVFGVEDSLVSTVGLLSGIVVAQVPHQTIILTGLVVIFVEAFSMAIGSFVSEDTVEMASNSHKSEKASEVGAIVMFLSYFLSGFVPLAPYLISNSPTTFWWSIGLTLLALLGLGLFSGRAFGIPTLRSGLRMLVLGGLAILVGTVVGWYIPAVR